MINTILNTDALSGLRTMAPQSVHCIVTSPPYFGLRAYGTDPYPWPEVEYSILGFPVKIPAMVCELGQEPDQFAFIGHQVLIFREAFRVLRDDGTAWVNMGDSYCGYKGDNYGKTPGNLMARTPNAESEGRIEVGTPKTTGLKAKDLIGIPWMLAYALRDDGWYLRSDIIWNKPNPMPESVSDRPTKSHEYIFLLSKQDKYYYDAEAIRTPIKDSSVQRLIQNLDGQNRSDRVPGKTNGNMKAVAKGYSHRGTGDKKLTGHSGNFDKDGNLIGDGKANKKTVWTVTTKPFSEAHFATYPQDLIVDMIKAGCPPDGVVLDMFFGSGTTGVVARKLYRNFIGIELNPKYAEMAEQRLKKELGLFV